MGAGINESSKDEAAYVARTRAASPHSWNHKDPITRTHSITNPEELSSPRRVVKLTTSHMSQRFPMCAICTLRGGKTHIVQGQKDREKPVVVAFHHNDGLSFVGLGGEI